MGRHLIIKRITAHLFRLHLSLPEEKIMHAVDQLDFSLGPPNEGNIALLVTFVYYYFFPFLFSAVVFPLLIW